MKAILPRKMTNREMQALDGSIREQIARSVGKLERYIEATVLWHLHEKYGRGGYLKLWIPWSENAARLNVLQDIIADPEAVLREVTRIYESLT